MTFLFAVTECINILFHLYVLYIIISKCFIRIIGLCVTLEQVGAKNILFFLESSLYNEKCRDI